MKRSTLLKKLVCLCLIAVLCCNLGGCFALDLYGEYVATSGNGVPRLFGNIILEMQTDCMEPTLSSGDRMIFEEVDPSTLWPGDIIAYWTVINGERVLYTSRIVEVYDSGDALVFATRGDNRNNINPLTVHESEVVGKYVRKAFLGWF